MTRFYSCDDMSPSNDLSPVTPATLPTTMEQLSSHSELCGEWVGVPGTLEGFEEFLRVSEVGWAKRKLATQMVKVYQPKEEISCNQDNHWLIVRQTPVGIDTKEFVVGGPKFESTFGPEKNPGTGEAYFRDDKLIMDVQMADQSTETLRWVENGRLQEWVILKKNGQEAVLKTTLQKVAR